MHRTPLQTEIKPNDSEKRWEWNTVTATTRPKGTPRRPTPAMPGAEIDVTAIDQNGKETPFFLVFNKVR
jgi:hypothetical protein